MERSPYFFVFTLRCRNKAGQNHVRNSSYNIIIFPSAISQDWHVESVIASTLSLLLASFCWEARKVNKSANFCVHHVTFWAATRVFSNCILTFFFSFLSFQFVVKKIHLHLLFSHVVRLLVP